MNQKVRCRECVHLRIVGVKLVTPSHWNDPVFPITDPQRASQLDNHKSSWRGKSIKARKWRYVKWDRLFVNLFKFWGDEYWVVRVQWQGKRKRGGMVKDKKRCVVWQRDRGGKGQWEEEKAQMELLCGSCGESLCCIFTGFFLLGRDKNGKKVSESVPATKTDIPLPPPQFWHHNNSFKCQLANGYAVLLYH